MMMCMSGAGRGGDTRVRQADAQKILIVEDNDSQRGLLVSILRKAGFEVVTATNGKEGLEQVRASIPDLVLSDVMMPQMDGTTMCKELRKSLATREVPLIFLTAMAREANQIEGLGIGADDYLVKPFTTNVLVAKIRAVLRRASIQKKLQEENRRILQTGVLQRELYNSASTRLGEYIRGIETICDALCEGLAGNMQDRQKRLVSRISEQAQLIEGMTSDLFNLFQAGSESIRLCLNPMNMRSIILDAIQTYREAADNKRIEIQQGVPDVLPEVPADAELIRQVVENLLSNAIKYTLRGGRIAVTTDIDPEEGRLQVVVEDTGQGIPANELPRVFERFEPISSLPTAGESKLGLGLPLVRKLVELHGGEVWVKSELSSGSQFGFWIPMRQKENLPAQSVCVG
jgi:signal transduction histidine kinase